MQGSMRQRTAGSWELRVFVGVDPETKRRRYRSVTVRGSRADAQRELDAMVASTRSIRDIGLRSPISELLEAWFAIASTSWAPTTVRQTRSVLDRYLHPRMGKVAVGDVTPAAIDATYSALHRGGGMRGQPLSAGTLARVHVVLRASLAQAQRWGWIWDNPAERAHRIVSVAPELSPPTPQELRALLDHVAERDLALHALLVTAAFTGARRAQLLGLRWRNVDLDHGRLSFTAGWVEGPNGPVLSATKTKRRHVVDLDVGSASVLVEHERRCRTADGGVVNPDGFVFSDDADGAAAWKPNRVTKAFGRLRRDAGLRQFRLHDLRHFMATQMLEAGVPLPVVSRRLDHRRVSTTLDRYAHAVPGGDAAAAQALWRIVQQAS
jgi:integrase